MNNEEYLSHYGILGQKWGVRRFQNDDGSLTAEGKKRYYQEIKAENKVAKNLGEEATVLGRAVKYSSARAARTENSLNRKLQKDPDGLKKSTQRAMERDRAAKRAALRVLSDYKKVEKEAEEHCKKLIEKYGQENVKNIKYKDVNFSKAVSEKMNGTKSYKAMNENTTSLSEWAVSGALSLASAASVAFGAMPIGFIFYPKGKNEKGAELAANYYMQEYDKEINKRYGW